MKILINSLPSQFKGRSSRTYPESVYDLVVKEWEDQVAKTIIKDKNKNSLKKFKKFYERNF